MQKSVNRRLSRGRLMLLDPLLDLLIGCARGDEILVLISFDSSFRKEHLVHAASKAILTLPAQQCRPAFIQAPGGNLVAREGLLRGSGFLFAKILGQAF